MIRKTIIVVLTLGAVLMGAIWVASVISADRCLFDLRIKEHAQLALRVERGAVVIVYSKSASLGQVVSNWHLGHRRFHLYRGLVELPVICGKGFIPPAISGGNSGANYRASLTLMLGLIAPCWAAFVLLGFYPTLAFIRGPLRRRRRRKRGLCVKCGYNLTGLPEPRCPECGTTFEQP